MRVPLYRDEAAIQKERDHRTPDGLPVGSFRTLMGELATLTRTRVVPAGADERAAFELLSQPTALQARALQLIGISPAGMETDRHSPASAVYVQICPFTAGSSD